MARVKSSGARCSREGSEISALRRRLSPRDRGAAQADDLTGLAGPFTYFRLYLVMLPQTRGPRRILEQVSRKNPDVVVHLGDIYYSGTEYEVENWFEAIWRQTLDLTSIRTFTLSGNHDMYSGGAAYYGLIDRLGQPARYFALRN